MRTTDLDISKLSVAERIQFAEGLWDSVTVDTGELARVPGLQLEVWIE